MSERLINEKLIYLRGNSGHQASCLETQLDWATNEAQKYGFELDFTRCDLEYMVANKLSRYGCVCLDDGISAASLERPGLLELINETISNPSVSHIFAYSRDRLGRSADYLSMVVIERQLLSAGVTLVFSNAISTPSNDGDI